MNTIKFKKKEIEVLWKFLNGNDNPITNEIDDTCFVFDEELVAYIPSLKEKIRKAFESSQSIFRRTEWEILK